MNYYKEIKKELINNEIYKQVKDYSKNKHDLETYYNVGKLLIEAGKHYGEGIIKEYSIKLTKELGKGYSQRNLRNMRQLYKMSSVLNWQTVSAKLTYSHYCEIMWLSIEKINYYIKTSIEQNLSVRALREKIKNEEYERLDDYTKNKLINTKENNITDLIKNPIIIQNKYNTNEITEKVLKKLILEDMKKFLLELGNGVCYISHEYPIKLGNRYNYIDLLLYNIEYNCYIVIELKVTELKKEHIGQIQVYMNYIDKNLKKNSQDKTIGIIITKVGNKFVIEYSSDSRIFNTTYKLI